MKKREIAGFTPIEAMVLVAVLGILAAIGVPNYSRYVTRTAPYLGTEGMQPIAPDLNVELGYIYRSAAVCDTTGDAVHDNPRDTKARAGTRATNREGAVR